MHILVRVNDEYETFSGHYVNTPVISVITPGAEIQCSLVLYDALILQHTLKKGETLCTSLILQVIILKKLTNARTL